MSDKLLYAPSPTDLGSRVCLISRVHGLQKVEEYFNNVPESMKTGVVFSSLLNCYAREKSAEKAEKLMQTMKDTGISVSTICYNVMMNMYYQMNAHERLDSLMLEMEQTRIPYDQFTLSIRLSAYASVSDTEGIEKTVESIASISQTAVDWSIYTIAADAYLKVNLVDKAVTMLKKCEELVNGKTGNEAFHMLIKLYAKTGRKEDLCRIWFHFKAERKVYNRGYITMIDSALKLDDVELAERVLDQWESGKLSYDFRIPDLLIRAYCKKGLVEKAGGLMRKAEANGVDPPMDAYSCLASKYLEDNEISKATEAIERAISSRADAEQRHPKRELMSLCMKHIQGRGDRDRLGVFMECLRSENVFSAAAVERLHLHLSNGPKIKC
ncbi:PREDICTED: pentatricopeptide repeat-containing protein At2g20710, mitochondrial-like [Tarenaya hassleriana]|uniref:pentatricopeptide repeat-containing protein At2g20710, mitochondrial-like n=1 Tax=Tarenaya hassleriana TaxID=28532 RepID=UPI0008FD2EBF|nr:PREDICTED: pentatricopeptide repeat-containing protein At2g20710, mitochondrial-like [Tarenaya hassleriana]